MIKKNYEIAVNGIKTPWYGKGVVLNLEKLYNKDYALNLKCDDEVIELLRIKIKNKEVYNVNYQLVGLHIADELDGFKTSSLTKVIKKVQEVFSRYFN